METSPSGEAASPWTRLTLICRMVSAGGAGEAVLAYLAGAVGQLHADGDVLPGAERGHGAAVGGAQPERDDVGGLLDALDDLPLPLAGLAALLVQPLLDRDQRVRHQPVHLVPGGGDLRGDGVAEDTRDRREQVLVDDGVLLGRDTEGGVLVRYALEHRVGPPVGVVQQMAGEGSDGAGEGPALGAGCLVAAVEQVAQQLGVGGEHAGVEALGDLVEVGADGGQGRADDGGGRGGQHQTSLDWLERSQPIKTCI
ncbi:hypothetical protein GCM10020256_55580 [Streptomyces thermocoprophilus]